MKSQKQPQVDGSFHNRYASVAAKDVSQTFDQVAADTPGEFRYAKQAVPNKMRGDDRRLY